MKGSHFRIYEVINDGRTVCYKIDRPTTGYIYPDVNIYSVAFTNGPIPFIPYATNYWFAEKYGNYFGPNDKEYNVQENILVYDEIFYEQ